MTFGAWLAAQNHRDDPVGDLARDYLEQCGCDTGSCNHQGRPQSVEEVRQDLDDHGAIPEAYGALDRAAAEWQGQRS